MKEAIPAQATNPTKTIITTSTIHSRTTHSFLNKHFTIWTIPNFIPADPSRPHLQTIINFAFLFAMCRLFAFQASFIFTQFTQGYFFGFFYVNCVMTGRTVYEISEILSNETIRLKS